MKKFIIAAFCFIFSAGAFAGNEYARTFNADKDTVYKALNKTIVKAGIGLQASDEKSGTVTTEWIPLKTVGFMKKGLRMRAMFLAEVVSPTSTKLTEVWTYQEQVAKDLPWQPTAAPADVEASAAMFFDQIQQNIK
jgi:hypothetical protein